MTALARNTDPATSHTAASMAKRLIKHHHELIVGVLCRYGPGGVDHIADLAYGLFIGDYATNEITGHQVGKRMNELLKAGRVELTGRTVTSFSGRPQREWRVVKAKNPLSAN